jgi:DNA repair exonuclease SbcCD nuclease subunit
MRIAILADLHIGYERFYEDAYSQARAALEAAAGAADMILIAGDIFDMRIPKPEVMAQSMTLFRMLAERKWEARVTGYEGRGKRYTDIPVIAIPGTHERRSEEAEDAVGILNLAGFLVDSSEARTTVEMGGEKVAVYALGGVSDERAKGVLKALGPRPVPGAFNVFMMHQSVYELLPFSEGFMRFDDLPDGFDLYVNGHIHSRIEGKVHSKPFLTPGSTVLTQLKEKEQAEKGFFVFDTQSCSYSFNSIRTRRFEMERIDISGKGREEIRKEINEKVRMAASGGGVPIVRILIEGKGGEEREYLNLDSQQIIKEYSGRAVVEIGSAGMDPDDGANAVGDAQPASIDGASIRDYGFSVFLDALRKKGYSLGISPTELFEVLAEQNKEKAVKKAASLLLDS